MEEARKKKFSMKVAAQKYAIASKNDNNSLFRERYRYNYIHWIKQQQSNGGT